MGSERGIVLLVDSARRPSFLQKEIKDLRQIAVNSSSRNLLSDIGAWDQVSTRAWPVHKMSIGTILHIRESCLKILILQSGSNLSAVENGTIHFEKHTNQLPMKFL